MTCVICNATATIVRLWNSEEPALGEYGLCEGCDSTSSDCRVCGALLKDRPDHRRYRVVYESPFDTVAHLWGFCSTSCEVAEEAGQWAPEYCAGCDRDIPAYALGEGRLPAHFAPDPSGEWLCLRCQSAPVELGG